MSQHSGPSRRGRRLRLTAALTLGGLVIAFHPLPAAAAGDPSLDRLIPATPQAGWDRAPESNVSPIVTRIEKADSNAASATVTAAAELWRSPTTTSFLAVTLTRWPYGVSGGELDHVASTMVSNECVAVTGNNPSSTGSVSGLPGSRNASCSAHGVVERLIYVRKGSISEMVESFGTSPLSLARLGDIASAQYSALPAAPSDTAGKVIRAVIGVVVLAAIGVLVALLVRRSRTNAQREPTAPWAAGGVAAASANPGFSFPPPAATGAVPPTAPQASPPFGAPAPLAAAVERPAPPVPDAPGWVSVDGDPLRQRYWTGATWGKTIRWDGLAWVDEASPAAPIPPTSI